MATGMPHRQKGAIGLMAALTLGLALVFTLTAVDTGRLYLEQRKLQRVVDMAALEAANQSAVCTGAGPSASALAITAAARHGFSPETGKTLVTTCGTFSTGALSQRSFFLDNTRNQAIRVVAQNSVTTSIAGGVYNLFTKGSIPANTQLTAVAVAATPKPPLAQLTIRSTLLSVNSAKSTLLNALTSALGGSFNLSVVGWQGIVDADINLLSFLDQLAIDAGVGVGQYDQLLDTGVTATKLLQAAAKVLQRGGKTAEVATNLGDLALSIPSGKLLKLGDILNIQTGTPSSGLDTNIDLFQLVQGTILLANKSSAAQINVPLDVLGVVKGNIIVKVIEPPQISAIGNPELAKADPMGDNRIYVRTAQIRTLITLNLESIRGVTNLLSKVLSTAGPLTSAVSNLLHLNLMGTVSDLLCGLGLGSCKVSDIQLLDTADLGISLDVASASSHVTDYTCNPGKTLTAPTQTAVAEIKVGKIDPANAFSNSATVSVTPIPVVDIGIVTCSWGKCSNRVAFGGGGLGLMATPPVIGGASTLVFKGESAPPDVNKAPYYLSTPNAAIVSSLSDTLNGVKLKAYRPAEDNLLGGLMSILDSVYASVSAIVQPLIKNLLSPLLDPVLNNLLQALGIDLATADVGANLTCGTTRAQLVI